MVLISFKDLYELHIFPEFHRCGSKIVPAMPFSHSSLKWAWQAEFLSHNLLSLQNCLFFTNKEMMLVSFFEINDGIWDKNFACHCHIHVLSHPWLTPILIESLQKKLELMCTRIALLYYLLIHLNILIQ